MFKLLAVAAAAALFTSTAMAQTAGSDCAPGATPGAAQGSTANANTHPQQGTCETVVQPNGQMTTQNGPAANSAAGTAAPNEAGGKTGAAAK